MPDGRRGGRGAPVPGPRGTRHSGARRDGAAGRCGSVRLEAEGETQHAYSGGPQRGRQGIVRSAASSSPSIRAASPSAGCWKRLRASSRCRRPRPAAVPRVREEQVDRDDARAVRRQPADGVGDQPPGQRPAAMLRQRPVVDHQQRHGARGLQRPAQPVAQRQAPAFKTPQPSGFGIGQPEPGQDQRDGERRQQPGTPPAHRSTVGRADEAEVRSTLAAPR